MKFFVACYFICFSLLCLQAQEESFQPQLDKNTRKYGLVDSANTWISSPQFDILQKLNSYFYYGGNYNSGNYIYRYDKTSHQLVRINYQLFDNQLYSDKFVIIQQYNKGPKGIMDIYGNEILPTFYSNIWIRENYFLGELDNKIIIFNQKGEKIFPQSFTYVDIKNSFIYVKTEDKRFPNHERFIVYSPDLKPITKDNWTINGRLGKDRLLLIKDLENQLFYINETGQIQIKSSSKFNYESPFSNGFAIVSSKENPKKFGFINTHGKLEIPVEYDEVGPFQEHYAYFSRKENGKLIEGLIDRNNTIVKIFPAKVTSKSIYYDSNEITYYLSNLETYDADGNFKKDENLIR